MPLLRISRSSTPTDLSLLDQARQEAERLIDQLWKDAQIPHKPRDYRRVARQAYLGVAKKKRKSQREWRKAIRQQLQYLRRDIKILHDLLDRYPAASFPLNVRDQRLFWVIQLLYDQQEWMYRHQSHSHPHRIVSLYQPWVRPMVRGKDKFQVEFGAKLNVSEIEGFCKVNRIGWESYNESQDLSMQIEQFRHTFGCYPELLLADQIYLTRQNQAMLKEKQIRIVGKPLGRPSKQPVTAYQKQKRKKEQNQRNHIEGKFGQGKIAYGLNRIRARRQDTAESWIAAIFFVMNLVNLLKISGQAIFWLFRQLDVAASLMIRPKWGVRIQMCPQYYSHLHSMVTPKPKLTFA